MKTGMSLLIAAALTGIAHAQEIAANITQEDLAKDNKLFLTVASKAPKWEKPTDPVKIAGPLYFVGTKGLSSFLFVTSEGNILFNTGMPSSGPTAIDTPPMSPRSQLATRGSNPIAACSAACNEPGTRSGSMPLSCNASGVIVHIAAMVSSVWVGMSRSTKSITSPLSRRRR